MTIDGIDVREMPQEQLHSLLGYVPQKGILFSGTIESNLKFGGAQITDAGMKKAASIAQATEFIDAKPEAMQAPLHRAAPMYPAARSSGSPSPVPLPRIQRSICSTTAFLPLTTRRMSPCAVR